MGLGVDKESSRYMTQDKSTVDGEGRQCRRRWMNGGGNGESVEEAGLYIFSAT